MISDIGVTPELSLIQFTVMVVYLYCI